MKKIEYVFVFLFFVAFAYVCYRIGYREASSEVKIPYESLYFQIDSLNREIINIGNKADSLQYKIDTTRQVIININKDYEEKYLDLSNAPISKQLSFFSEYLSKSN